MRRRRHGRLVFLLAVVAALDLCMSQIRGLPITTPKPFGGEAWTCDGQTNGINFILFVCPSPWWLDGVGGEAWTWDGQTNGKNFYPIRLSVWLLDATR